MTTIMNRTRLARLRRWVKVLEKVEKDGRVFDIGTWIKPPQNGKAGDCGTAACALGWAALDPVFTKAGLRRRNRFEPWMGKFTIVAFGRETHDSAASAFFGLSSKEAKALVMPLHYRVGDYREIKPRHVIAKISRLIKKYERAGA